MYFISFYFTNSSVNQSIVFTKPSSNVVSKSKPKSLIRELSMSKTLISPGLQSSYNISKSCLSNTSNNFSARDFTVTLIPDAQLYIFPLEDLLDVRKKLVKAKEMYAEVKSYEDKLGTAHYRNTTIRILDDLEPLTIYI